MERMNRILVVDDDVEARGRLHDLLAKAGYDVDVAPNAAAAFEQLAACAPKAMLVDLDVEGRRFCSELKKAGATDADLKKIPVIVISAQGEIDAHGEPVHAHAMLPKPLEADRVLATVRAAMA